jgi:excisionase family DNA binding protein
MPGEGRENMTGRTRPIGKLRTIAELADLWEVSPRTIQRLIKSGALSCRRIGRLVRIADADATDFLDENEDW